MVLSSERGATEPVLKRRWEAMAVAAFGGQLQLSGCRRTVLRALRVTERWSMLGRVRVRSGMSRMRVRLPPWSLAPRPVLVRCCDST